MITEGRKLTFDDMCREIASVSYQLTNLGSRLSPRGHAIVSEVVVRLKDIRTNLVQFTGSQPAKPNT